MANPPITIGPFDNVPAPGSPIGSPWAQQLTQFAVDAKTVLFNSVDYASGESGDIGGTPATVTSATVAVKAGRLYEVRASMIVVHKGAAGSGGGQIGISVPSGDIAAHDVYLPASNVGIWSHVVGTWVPPADSAAAVVNVKLVKSWWSSPNVRYAKGAGSPISLMIRDLGKYP